MKYFTRAIQIFNAVQFDCFHTDQAWKIIQEYEPSASFDAILKSLERARWRGIVNIEWRERKSIAGYTDLSSKDARKKIWYFTLKSILNMSEDDDFKIKEENYPLYAKILLDDKVALQRRLF